MKAGAAFVAVIGLGLLIAGCSTGPSASETTACAPFLKVTLPAALGGAREGTNESIALRTSFVDNLIHSGNPTLTRYGRAMTRSESGSDFVNAVLGAQAECRRIGAG
jgi:hypothetical protein